MGWWGGRLSCVIQDDFRNTLTIYLPPAASEPLFLPIPVCLGTPSAEGTAYTSSANGFVGASGGEGTTPVTTTTPAGVSGEERG